MTKLSFDTDNLLKKYSPLEFAMAYGSSIFKQNGYTEKDRPIIDLILAVNSPSKWHENNLMKNPEDYYLKTREKGLEFIDGMQEKWTNIYYNVHVPFQERKIKYGIISQENLISDLTEWETLYIAGRLHKPAKILKSNEKINNTVKTNLGHAINTALLLLPENFTEKDFYMEITGISYIGDIRMIFGENKNKVKNIVDGNPEGFYGLY
jgi:translocator assembly and maintenance protein 41